jgi:hypothetical protein
MSAMTAAIAAARCSTVRIVAAISAVDRAVVAASAFTGPSKRAQGAQRRESPPHVVKAL